MALIDLVTISAIAREQYISIGKRYSSITVLNLASRHLKALLTHGPDLALHGFGAPDATRLVDAHETLLQESVNRTGARGGNAATVNAHELALRRARRERLRARAILDSVTRTLRYEGTDSGIAAALQVEGGLRATKNAGHEGEKLAEQLDVLLNGLTAPPVVTATADRGGPEAVADLTAALTTLRASNLATTGSSTRLETERMDLLDGLIITLARSARKAAVAASKRLGTPALADKFSLDALYAPASAETDSEEPEAPPAQPTTPAPAQPSGQALAQPLDPTKKPATPQVASPGTALSFG
ncbi:hypothetical protein [Chondromyces apiculatus]|uniref:Uncharacterized protein n=1 Tax=Chondromyces apiculatus DSM 436 TaxID=1192034 RepID=A0A017T2B5_9BACT|nr:hypothetical protein [Chondromyces apiculatus]EYF02686.1 Hypothetical protein CAP_6576 [Chondromyces apiculatus DSM 436]